MKLKKGFRVQFLGSKSNRKERIYVRLCSHNHLLKLTASRLEPLDLSFGLICVGYIS